MRPADLGHALAGALLVTLMVVAGAPGAAYARPATAGPVSAAGTVEPDPLAAVGAYLTGLAAEADARGYRFDRTRILSPAEPDGRMPVTLGQLELEWRHLAVKLAARSPADAERWRRAAPTPHPLFHVVPGGVASWERAA